MLCCCLSANQITRKLARMEHKAWRSFQFSVRIFAKLLSSPTIHSTSSACKQREGVMRVRLSCPSSTPTTMQLYLSRMPLSLRVLPMKGLDSDKVTRRSFISRFSISVSSGCCSDLMALDSAVNCSSFPMA